MRIAVSGTHSVGKSTLIADLHRKLPTYRVAEEPYYALLDEGSVFPDRPSPEDFETQLERSIEMLSADTSDDILFDRSPADFLAYLSALGAHDAVGDWLGASTAALHSLDLIVLVPIEQPDRIAHVTSAAPLRRQVDELLREILVEDSFGFGLPVLTVPGSEAERVRLVLAALRQRA